MHFCPGSIPTRPGTVLCGSLLGPCPHQPRGGYKYLLNSLPQLQLLMPILLHPAVYQTFPEALVCADPCAWNAVSTLPTWSPSHSLGPSMGCSP